MIYNTWVFHLLYTLQVALAFSFYSVSFCYWVYFSIKNTGRICLLLRNLCLLMRKLYRVKFVCILLVCDETLHDSSLENELILKDFGHIVGM
jgi:hypothetical protein